MVDQEEFGAQWELLINQGFTVSISSVAKL